MRVPITATMGSERTANRLLIALFYEVNSSARKRKNIMCAFHHSRQTGILFEREGKEHHVCFSRLTTSFVQGEKDTKVSIL